MREFTIKPNDAGQRLDKFILKAVPSLAPALMHKYIRLKRIKLNGKRADFSYKLAVGDVISMYINDEFFIKNQSDKLSYVKIRPSLDIVYEDDNILLVDKKPGVLVHSDQNEQFNTLINHIKAYLYQSHQWDPSAESSFTPALANRIDRNTGGIVIAAKNAEALRVLNDKIKSREIKKYYLCLIEGAMSPPSGRMDGFLFKDAKQNRVYITDRRVPGSKIASTVYKTISFRNGISLMECELITGRTHQIRAQFAKHGCPLAGDSKYGTARSGSHQALYSYKLKFDMSDSLNILSYLNGKTFQVKNVPFADKFI